LRSETLLIFIRFFLLVQKHEKYCTVFSLFPKSMTLQASSYRIILGCFVGFLCVFFLATNTFAAKLFSDVPPQSSFFDAVSALEQRGILNGFSDGSFRPDDRISRAAALKVVLLSAGVEMTGVATARPFPDVPKDEWFAPIAKKGQELGIVQGDGNGNFLPSRNVSRAEALAMLFRTNGTTIDPPTSAPFSDVPLSAWYAGYFAEAKSTGLLRSDPIDPQHLLTRGELSDLTYRFFRNDWDSTETEGKASYYADMFEGRTTASGERFSNAEYTAAHRTFPFGTRVRVTQQESLRSVVVRINDRGPYADGRVIDISSAAFQVLAPLSNGLTDVMIEKVPESTPLGPPEQCTMDRGNTVILEDFYEGMSLFSPLPTVFRTGEVYTISGEFTADEPPEDVIAFYGPEGEQRLFHGEVSGSVFTLPVFFPEEGEFLFSVYPGKSGKAKAENIKVITPECESNIEEETTSPKNLRHEVKNGETVFLWDNSGNDLFRLRFSQKGKEVVFFVSGSNKVSPPPQAFEYFEEGPALVEIWGSRTDEKSNRITEWKYGGYEQLFVTERVSRKDNRLKDVTLTETFSLGQDIVISGTTEETADPVAYVIDPDENIFEIPLNITDTGFYGRFAPQTLGTHILEINRNDALTLFVGASVPEGVTPLLPDFFDLNPAGISEDISEENRASTLLRYINRERRVRQLPELLFDDALQELAQFRADDMCERGYFSHVDPDGKKAEDYRVFHNVQTAVAENIARDSGVKTGHEGLMRSPAHRKPIINPSYTRVGFGFCRPKNEEDILTIVEIFGGEPFIPEATSDWREKILADINSVRLPDPIVPSETMQSVAQQWANRMAEKDFWGFEDGEDSLETSLRDAGVKEYAQGVVLKLGSISDVENAFSGTSITLGENDQKNFLIDTVFKRLGVGIAQSDTWEMYIVLLATH
jgi:rare lipoprotein A